MRYLLLICLTFASLHAKPQAVHQYFEGIRNNTAKLTAFFSQMPKGGDIHHHYSGAVYGETFWDEMLAKDYFINTATLKLSKVRPEAAGGPWFSLSELRQKGQLTDVKEKLLQKWSVKDYSSVSQPSHRLFFESFDYFDLPGRETVREGLIEIKERAIKENVSYIETMFQIIQCDHSVPVPAAFNDRLKRFQETKQAEGVSRLLDSLYEAFRSQNIADCAHKYNRDVIQHFHQTLGIDDSTFTMRYQNFVLRFREPADLFKDLFLAFESANSSELVVGINIVSPEHNEISLRDYWLHMQFFRYFRSKYPAVKTSLHAGELTMELVKPEELTWHIHSAVYDAQADRIGHGVDIAYEKDVYKLMEYMKEKEIPVEINLVSNEFILNVRDDQHPVMLYREFGVPLIISTDDAGVLRTNLTRQFVLLANRYRQLSYADIKEMVYNSIKYSFIEDKSLKHSIIADLDVRFNHFEQKVIELGNQGL